MTRIPHEMKHINDKFDQIEEQIKVLYWNRYLQGIATGIIITLIITKL
jgi:hypothetical protein